jgi:hypothetical protein
MRGIFSSAPSPGSIRLLLGSKLLLLIQAWLVLCSDRLLHGMLWFVVGAIVVIAILCLVGAVLGEPQDSAEDHHRPWRRRAEGRHHE